MDKSEVVQLPVVPLNAALALFGDHLQDIEEACTDNILWDIERLTREEPRNEIQEEVDRLAIVAATKEKLRSLKQVKARIEYAQYRIGSPS